MGSVLKEKLNSATPYMVTKASRDLQTIVTITLLTAFVISIPFSILSLRIVLGLLFIFLLPCYALIATLFPGKGDLDWIERVALSLGFSITVASLTGLLLNYTPWGIKSNLVLISLPVFIISMSAVAAFRCMSLSVDKSFFTSFSAIKKRFIDLFHTESNVIKVMAVISFLLIISALVLIKNNPATGYEISIYSSVPLVWVFLIGSIADGITIIVHQAFSEEKNNFWLIGFLILILNNFIVLSMHALRGYLHYAGSDHMCHLQWIKNLIESGHVESGNFYPAIHILGSQISEICNIAPEIVVKYLPAFLSILFLMLFMLLLAKSSLLKKRQILLVCAASCVLFFNNLHVQIYPHTFSVLLFPAIVYFYFRGLEKPSWQFSLLFIILLILLPYTHPSGSVTMIFLLIAMELSRIIYDKRCNPKGIVSKIAVNPILISFITFFMWMSSFAVFGAKLSSLWSSIFEPYKNPWFTRTLETAVQLEWVEVVEYNLKMYGDNIIYIALALIAGMIIIKRVYKKETGIKYLFLLFMFFLTCIPIEYILYIGAGSETTGRMLNLLYMMTVAPVLVGFVLYELFKNKKRAKAIAGVSLILILTFSISIFSVYHSPWTFSPSWHITNMDVEGSEWFFAHRNSTLKFDAMGIDGSLMQGTVGLIPAHFNYSYHSTLGESLAQDSYAVINKRCKLANADPMVAKTRLNIGSGWGFNEEDFGKLEHDPSVNKLYSNGEFDAFFVYSNSRNDVKYAR